jgi:hypothetical protein
MPPLRPTFTLTAGGVRSSTASPVAGPRALVVERDMDIPADAVELRLMERAGIALGDAVTVALGHDGEEEPVFTGSVAALRPTLAGVVVRALGTMNDLLNLRLATTYENQTAGAIARDLIGQAGLTAGTIDEGPQLPRYAVDHRLSAFAHLQELADRLGYELFGDRDGAVRFQALGPGAGLDAAGGLLGAVAGLAAALPGLEGGEGYAFGRHLLGANARSAPPGWGEVEVGGESPMSGQGDATAHWLTVNDADYRGSAGDGAPGLLVLDPVARTKDLADRFAAGHLAVAARRAHQVWLTVLGRPGVELGDPVAVSEVPDAALNGAGYVRAIRHRFGEGTGYVTDLRVSLGGG